MTFTINEDDYLANYADGDEEELAHYGILRKSGRYPWGSGGPEYASNAGFLGMVDGLKKQGLSEAEIARGLGISTTQLRAAKSIAKTEEKTRQVQHATRLKNTGMSNVAIAKEMGLNESTVRTLLKPDADRKAEILESTVNVLKNEVDKHGYIDVGAGVEQHMGVTKDKLGIAVAHLKEKGYDVHYVLVDQLGTSHQTRMKVLVPPNTTYSEVFRNRDNIRIPGSHSDDGGKTYFAKQPPISVDAKRVKVNYAEDGGAKADGVIYVRRGKEDLTLGKSNYAQVRIAVGGTHYLKGMAMYRDDLPDGVDLVFNTNKSNTGNKLDAMKKMKDDPTDPFGAIVRQLPKLDAFGREIPGTVRSAMNIVNEEGSWGKWSRSLSSQMLSKQMPNLARDQLAMTYERKRREFDEIMSLTNPVVKKRLLEAFSDDADSSAVHLKAAALPRQASHVILPINSMKPNEVYAPNYKDGEPVVLIRYPHGGIFEIPELRVNNQHPEAKRLLGNAPDAIGIHHTVAERLSGADFDGDTVLVIPNRDRKVMTKPPLEGLKGFDPMQYKLPDDSPIKRMDARTKGIQMGLVSNLITDMHAIGAPDSELARAVRHSMVVIDGEKHNLDYRQSARDNGIPALMKKYQGRSTGGAATIISRANSDIKVPERKLRSAAKGGPIDKVTGKKVYEYSGATYTQTKTSKSGKVTEKEVLKPGGTSKRLAEEDNAHALSSGTRIEKIYADHSNKLKALANTARKEMVHTRTAPYSPSAKAAYSHEVRSLDAKLALALRNAPLERQAHVLGNAQVRAKTQANPDMEKSEKKKLKAKALDEARKRTGANKTRIEITDAEWAAIQAGAISSSKLNQILANADLDKVKQLATPKEKLLMSGGKKTQALAMLRRGYTQAEVADALGVSLSTLKQSIGE
ncbi:helix-turn-helix DNA-binding domain protein [Streptomyces phage Scap1]|uniref:Helix-turn-helix DNA binding domain protein n=1 Tax=Streptomyces phage Scap1 TaxID=2041354 RepID=A0A2D1GNZ1_9CAUD|nr:RNA-dependent RNA polymerase [Streptomyces phage Scap1]ATN93704.1 helix-turn-helix DNA-binding domain protein [Streptomyces phage Scap1]